MKLEERYVVLKISDIEKYISTEKLFTPHSLSSKDFLDVVCLEIRNGRMKDCKSQIQCLCIEKDWPEYEPTLALLSARVDAENKE